MSHREFLQGLGDALWRRGKDITSGTLTDRYGLTPHFEKRRLTEDEWQRVQDIIKEHGLGVQMINACMGFGCGIKLWEPPEYPCVPPAFMVTITQDHIPVAEGEPTPRFDAAWEVFHPLASTEENARLLEFMGIEALKAKVSYEY